MTIITIRAPEERFTKDEKAVLSKSLTDAVLKVEIGQQDDRARMGFQVYFESFSRSSIAIGGQLVSETSVDVMHIDITVMDGDWPREDRRKVLANVYDALVNALKIDAPSPAWWITFRRIEDGSWGSRGSATSILDLLDTGVFSNAKATAIRQTMMRK